MFAFIKRILGFAKTDMDINKAQVSKEAQEHWNYPTAINVLIKEKYDKESTDPDNYNYIVFIDKDGVVDWEYSGKGEREMMSRETTAAISKASIVDGLPCDILSKKELIAFKTMVAEAVVMAIERDFVTSRELLRTAKSYYNDRVVVQSRIWSTIVLFIVGFLLCLGLMWLGGFEWSAVGKIYQPMVFGVLGAVIGHFRRITLSQSDSTAGCFLRILNVVGHLFCGCVLGLIGVIFFKSGFCPYSMRELCDSPTGCVVISFTGGLFEMFIPSLLSKFVAHADVGSDDEK